MDISSEIVDDRVSSTFQISSLGNCACATVARNDIAENADAQ